jgi:SAM-dependent methyltransferase
MGDGDYVLGTRDDEVDRLGLQHRVWRSRMLDAWRRAGVTLGQTFLDIGAGPGFATLDAAEWVGPSGQVLALERSPLFLGVLRDRAAAAGLTNIEAREQDVAEQPFGEALADRSWCRWLLSFVADPCRTVSHIARALKPGGVAVFHEYADYGTWQMLPPSPDLERFRALVKQSWRDAGGEPDIALHLPTWLRDAGLEIVEARPLIDIVERKDLAWQWPASFMATNAERLAELGYIDATEAERLATTLDRAPGDALMITPLVLELIARRS